MQSFRNLPDKLSVPTTLFMPQFFRRSEMYLVWIVWEVNLTGFKLNIFQESSADLLQNCLAPDLLQNFLAADRSFCTESFARLENNF